MKRIKMMIQCFTTIIKKNFFKSPKADFNHSCKEAFDFINSNESGNKDAEEYLNSYNATTRWQTI